MLGGIVYDLGNYVQDYDTLDDFFAYSFWDFYSYKYPIMFGITFCIHIPLCLTKEVAKLRFTSLLGVSVYLIIALILIIESPFYMEDYWTNIYLKDDPTTHVNFIDISSGFTSKLNFFKGTGAIFFAYACHFGAFPIMKNLSNPTIPRLSKVFSRSMTLATCVYITVATLGFLSCPINTPDFIVSRYSVFNHDIFITLGKFLFIVVLFFKIPVHFNALRLCLLRLIYDSTEYSQMK